MKHTIWKFDVTPDLWSDMTTVKMPRGFKILSTGMQGSRMFVWAEVWDQQPLVDVDFVLVGTGHEIPDYDMKYIGTNFVEGFVFHLYMVKGDHEYGGEF